MRKLSKVILDLKKQNEISMNEIMNQNKSAQEEYQQKLEEKEKENKKIQKEYLTKLEEKEKENQRIQGEHQKKLEENKTILQKYAENIEQNLNNYQKQVEENKKTINDLSFENQKMNDKNRQLSQELKALFFKENSDIYENIVNIIGINQEVVLDIKGVEERSLYIMCNARTYIIKNKFYEKIEGLITTLLELKNEDLIIIKNRKVLIFSNYNFTDPKAICNINCYTKQIIESPNNNEFLILSEDSTIKLIKYGEETVKDDIYKSTNICSVIHINNNNEIAIIFTNGKVIFFDVTNKNKLEELNLKCNYNIILIDISFIFKEHLYITLFDSIYKIDINKKAITSSFCLNLLKIFNFNNNFLGIYKNKLFKIYFTSNNDLAIKQIYEDNSNIQSLYLIRENKIILVIKNKLLLLNLEIQQNNN